MKIAEQLLRARDGLKAWAEGYGGTAEVATDPVHLFALLANKPGSVRVCVMFKGEDKRGELEESGFVDRKFLVVVSRGKGFTAAPGDSLVKGSGGGPALFDLVDEARQLVRGLAFEEDSTEVAPDCRRVDLFAMPDGVAAVDAYEVEFWIGTQLESPVPRGRLVNRDVLVAQAGQEVTA